MAGTKPVHEIDPDNPLRDDFNMLPLFSVAGIQDPKDPRLKYVRDPVTRDLPNNWLIGSKRYINCQNAEWRRQDALRASTPWMSIGEDDTDLMGGAAKRNFWDAVRRYQQESGVFKDSK